MLHLRMIYDTPKRQLQADTHRKLKMELEEERIASAYVEKHNRHLRESANYRQRGIE